MPASLDTLLEPHPRVRVLREGLPSTSGQCVLYWMQRTQRGHDNAALNLAIAIGNALDLPVLTGFGLTDQFPGSQIRQKRFVVEGLVDASTDLKAKGVPLVVRIGPPDQVALKLANESNAAFVVGDENPLHFAQTWQERLVNELAVPYRVVDADVVVPSSIFPKEEFAARTLRPKLHRVLADFLKPIPNPTARVAWKEGTCPVGELIELDHLLSKLKLGGAGAVPTYKGGRVEAGKRLKLFLGERIGKYANDRNEPTPYMTSELSAHLHFGHINPLTIALAVQSASAPDEDIAAYIEEMIVRRELSINYVARNPRYDTLLGCPDWALKTLAKHASDPRPFLYDERQLVAAETHDPLWNAAQKEMMITGRMHNYLRMYWAKKILEWSPDAETAFNVALLLNDRYEMDGRDPNGYTGVAWAIGAKHDRPWGERPIFGTVRFMSYQSTRKKFDSDGYIARVRSLEQGRLFGDV